MVMKAFLALEERGDESVVEAVDDQAQEVDLRGLEAADQAASHLTDRIRNAAGAALSLEAIARYLKNSVASDGLSQKGAMFANLAIENICADGGIPSAQLVFSMEAYQQSPSLALEGALETLGAKIKDAWKFIQTELFAFFRLLAEKMDYFKRNVGNVERKIHQLQGLVERVDKDQSAKQADVKPSQPLLNLIYLTQAMPEYAEGVCAEVNALLKAHASLYTKTITSKQSWLEENHEAASQDVAVFDSFKVNTSDFLMLEAQPIPSGFNKRIPVEGNALYRSKELPGGKAVFTEIEPEDKRGVLAIEMLFKASSCIDTFDSVKYDEVSKQLLAAEASCFKTLPLVEIKKRLKEVAVTLQKTKEWYDVVFGEIWKNKSFDFLATSLIERSAADNGVYGSGNYANPASKYLAELVYAVIEVRAGATGHVHQYAFATCFSVLDYVEKSLQHYAD